MENLFYIAGATAVFATALSILATRVVHALLCLIVSFLAVSVVFFTLGCPFIAVLEVIIYAGAIMVLFLFAVMMLNRGTSEALWRERASEIIRSGTPWGSGYHPAGFSSDGYFTMAGGSPNSYYLWDRRGRKNFVWPLSHWGGTLVGAPSCRAHRGLSHRRAQVQKTDKGLTMGLAQKAMVLAWLLFLIGLFGVLVRKDLVVLLMSLEIMLNAAGLAFVSAGAFWGERDGQVMFIFVLAFAAAEVSVGLALVLQLYGTNRSLDSDAASNLRG